MTDKEIIINGVDVSECEYRDCRNFCHCDKSKENEGEERITGKGGCKYNPNCYFKQRERAMKENEKLKIQLMQKSEVDTFFNTPIEGWDNDACKICEYKQNYQAKEQECEELKEKQKELLHDCNSCKFHQYRQALDKIEDIADDYNRVEKSSQYYRDGFDEIQNIINKVKEQ